jgi:hypothetical protein
VRAALALFLLALGCGSNRPEIPPELLEGSSDCGSGAYPNGPFGVDQGTTAENACFRGWRRPNVTEHVSRTLEDISLGSFYDRTGDEHELIIVNTAALWCSVCQVEHRDLPRRYDEFAPRGLVILGALFQDERAEPADLSDLTAWVETFEVPFPMALDPAYQLGVYASAETAPLNLVIDARTMRILQKYVGDQSSLLWPYVEEELGRREAEPGQ